MKKDEKNQARELGAQELEQRIRQNRQKMYEMRHQVRLGQLKNNSILGKLRRDTALYETFLTMKRKAAVKP